MPFSSRLRVFYYERIVLYSPSEQGIPRSPILQRKHPLEEQNSSQRVKAASQLDPDDLGLLREDRGGSVCDKPVLFIVPLPTDGGRSAG